MTKAEIASYLVSLHTLLEAQSKGVQSVPSVKLADEYEKHWGLLKKAIEESADEARPSDKRPERLDEAGANPPRSEPRRG